ncbi:solute carrier organic anion transporter family member 2B1 isoform X1 [Salarias fasciatus]|uniref:solute carrier organic anion transporter family member 2B1 isoform X1 n=1 Tax=Salarias fasciatus TaxID=181472 RepID=UPI0011767588|nr:solute carrier organic anion transporter family member 2B1 isoform X1 [Salarias fasciatus]XP_029957567.1 solute carrier organic anion transporter family member 2B1 isoform X1 [Salarias fasciatus]XP_029957568.1 solute carrier organic anion transporter family member 2B1 isoform X1 [Salarias fasciatus]XP_029957569.1 solute carrier organic anion transporter family member 2B1 isoform X1 [Salarias fasciatus]
MMVTNNVSPEGTRSLAPARPRGLFNSIKFFVFCQSLLQLAQLLVSGCMKSSISTIERRYGLSSQKSGMLASFNEVGNTILIIFVSFFGSRVHRPRCIGGGALLACLASLLMAMPHLLSETYDYTGRIGSSSSSNSSGLCLPGSAHPPSSSNETCRAQQSPAQQMVYPLLVLGQLLLGIGTVPIQPFGISYIDDHASKKNSPLYLGILLAMTSIGPAFGFVMGSFMLRYYVDFDKVSPDQIELDSKDLRWVGAWWLGFLVASCLLFLTAVPFLFFPRNMLKEDHDDAESPADSKQQQTDPLQELSIPQFLKSFPSIALRTLRSPIYLLVVLAQVNLAALLSGLATFMAKFIERQFNQTVAYSGMMIGGVLIPLVVLGTILGGALMRRLSLSVSGASKLCSVAILLCVFTALPLLMIGCPTQKVDGVFPQSSKELPCSTSCGCPLEDFNPVCGSDGVEFRSPCHAGCSAVESDASNKPTNYTSCACVSGGLGSARPGTCGSGCSHLLRPFVALLALTGFIASFSQAPSYMMILRTVPAEDKSFAVGVQYMLFRVLAFLPGPVLYGSVIDTTCILWGRKCGKQTSCHYYNLDAFRQRFLGLQTFFVFGGLLCFLLTVFILRRRAGCPDAAASQKADYELVSEQKPPADASSREKHPQGVQT